MTHFPWGPYTGQRCEKEVDVLMLSHNTHYFGANYIINSGMSEQAEKKRFKFQPYAKVGKDGHSMKTYRCDSNGEPNEDTTYSHVQDSEDLFPGYYSWWSPVYKGTCASSKFGSIQFKVNFNDLMQCYKESYDPPLEEIHLRCGGTLRYKLQACKVIIVCSGKYYPTPEQDYPIIERFKEKESIKLQFDNPFGAQTSNSYDSFAFAFYFPNSRLHLICSESIVECHEVDHNTRTCAKKYKRNCPDRRKEIFPQLKSKMEDLKKRREEREKNATMIMQNVNPQAANGTQQPLDECDKIDAPKQSEISNDTVQTLESEEQDKTELASYPICMCEEPVDEEEDEPPKKKLALTIEDDTI